tara:strand:- start:160 stop:624 length:465 start_codon:yes stop_codon:yes gene_type:complete
MCDYLETLKNWIRMENKETYIKLFKLVDKLKNSDDPKRKYEYILWLGKKLKIPNNNILIPENKVQGCVSEVFVKAILLEGKLYWEGYSDALITKGLLAFLISGMNELTPKEVVNLNNKFIEDTGLKTSLTPSRSNGFLNILLKMQSQANEFLSE